MDDWPAKLKLVSVLSTTKELLLRSAREGWPDEDPTQVAQELDEIISHVLRPDSCPVPKHALIDFAPTGPVQEIAMANGWHDAYLVLSEEYDALKHLLGRRARA
jgi:hypothetical protein